MTTFQAKLALRYLRGRKLRTTLTLFAIVFGVMIIVGFNGLLPAMQQALQGNLSAVAGQVDLTISSETRGAFDATVADQVRAIPEVTLVAPALVRPLVLPNAQALTASSGSTINTFIVRGVDPAVATEMNHITLAAGRFLHSDDQNTVLIANNLAQETGRGVGDTLNLRPPPASSTSPSLASPPAGRRRAAKSCSSPWPPPKPCSTCPARSTPSKPNSHPAATPMPSARQC